MSWVVESCLFPTPALKTEIEALAGGFEPAWHTRLNADSRDAWFLVRSGPTLVGFLTVFDPSGTASEVSAFVSPTFRRQGIFSSLLDQAQRTWRSPGRRWLLVASRAEPEGLAVARHRGTWSFTEWTLGLRAEDRLPFTGLPDGLTLALAGLDDVDETLGVLGRANDDSESGYRGFLTQVLEDPDRRLFVLRYLDRIVGVGGLHHHGQTTGVFALAVDPEFQGRGWGKALALGLLDLGSPGTEEFVLDVDSTNGRAEALYRRLGFGDRSVTDYYEVAPGE